jgi:hypothetical protein
VDTYHLYDVGVTQVDDTATFILESLDHCCSISAWNISPSERLMKLLGCTLSALDLNFDDPTIRPAPNVFASLLEYNDLLASLTYCVLQWQSFTLLVLLYLKSCMER